MKRQEIKALTEKEFLDILKVNGIYEKFMNNNCTCDKCGEIVNLDNILSIKKTDENIIIYCNKISCSKG
jgi:glucan phosphoethanolaminetransferase (alkaline phosphatase superfamily)